MDKVKALLQKAKEHHARWRLKDAEEAAAKCLAQDITYMEPFLAYLLRWKRQGGGAFSDREVEVSVSDFSVDLKAKLDDLDSLSDFYLDVIKPLLRLHPLWSVPEEGERLGGAKLSSFSRQAKWCLYCSAGCHEGEWIYVNASFTANNKRCRFVKTGSWTQAQEIMRIECDV